MRSISSQLRAFQSTPPVWEATFVDDPTGTPVTFQSTPPVWEATTGNGVLDRQSRVSIHASRVGGDRNIRGIGRSCRQILALHRKVKSIVTQNSPQSEKYSVVKVQNLANLMGISCSLWVRNRDFQVINVPSRSRLAFAPTCSTRLRHSSPR